MPRLDGSRIDVIGKTELETLRGERGSWRDNTVSYHDVLPERLMLNCTSYVAYFIAKDSNAINHSEAPCAGYLCITCHLKNLVEDIPLCLLLMFHDGRI
jgi:hypothetical protein